MRKFKIGDKVKFTNFDPNYDEKRVYNFYTLGIPEEKISHGSTVVYDDYFRDFGLVVDIYEEYYIVQYKDVNGKMVRLGFKEGGLEIVKPLDKFVVGDRVRVISKSVPSWDEFGIGENNMKQSEVGYITKINGDPYNFNDETNCFAVFKVKGCESGDFFALQDLELIEDNVIIEGTKVVISVPRDHLDWRLNGTSCVVDRVSFFNDGDLEEPLYIVELDKQYKFTRDELEITENA